MFLFLKLDVSLHYTCVISSHYEVDINPNEKLSLTICAFDVHHCVNFVGENIHYILLSVIFSKLTPMVVGKALDNDDIKHGKSHQRSG